MHVLGAAVLAFVAGTSALSPAWADDPRDPTMTPEAIARDRAQIRRMNEDQLAYVRQRDAGYAQGWRDYDAGRRDDRDTEGYAADRNSYQEARREYDRQMRQWRQDVAACRAGYYDRCGG